MWYWINWGISIVLVSLFFISIAANIQIFMTQIRRKSPDEQAPSFVRFAGGIAGAIGLFICPNQTARYFFWLPLVIDVLTIPSIYFVVAAFWKIKGFKHTAK